MQNPGNDQNFDSNCEDGSVSSLFGTISKTYYLLIILQKKKQFKISCLAVDFFRKSSKNKTLASGRRNGPRYLPKNNLELRVS